MHDFGYARHSIKDDAFTGHGGESPEAVYDRVNATLERARAHYPKQNLILPAALRAEHGRPDNAQQA